MTASVDAEEKINGSPSSSLLECLIKALVARVCRTPDLVLKRLMYIIFGVRLDDEETRLNHYWQLLADHFIP